MADKIRSSGAVQYVPALTGIRALAALLVLALHADQNVPAGASAALPFISRGYLGVDFFFVLSGFIITHVYFSSLAQPNGNAIRIFLWHRFIRLYPVHVTVLAALVALIYLALAHDIPLNNPEEWRAADLPWQLTLLHAWGVTPRPGWNVPSWSISAEWFAYLLFPPLALALSAVRERLTVLLIAVAALAGTAALFATASWGLNSWTGLPALSRVFGEFLCGAALCRALALGAASASLLHGPLTRPSLCSGHPLPQGERVMERAARLWGKSAAGVGTRDRQPAGYPLPLRERVPSRGSGEAGEGDVQLVDQIKPALAPQTANARGDVAGAAAFALFLIGACIGLHDFGLVALLALTILGAATAQTFLARALGSAPLVWLGEISYSIYMVHFPALLVIGRFWKALGFLQWGAFGKAAAFSATLILVVALAGMLFHLVERPARTRLRDQMGRLAPA
jgi:peptidoglycan/LPS O-acetylase OafA/YrhL